MRNKRVVLLTSQSLLASAIRSVLADADGIELCPVATADPEWQAAVKELAPRVVLLDSADGAHDNGMIARLLEELPTTKVIAVNLRHTGVDVYRMTRVQEIDLEGLLCAIRGKRRAKRLKAEQ